jgi:hypothetical protein
MYNLVLSVRVVSRDLDWASVLSFGCSEDVYSEVSLSLFNY